MASELRRVKDGLPPRDKPGMYGVIVYYTGLQAGRFNADRQPWRAYWDGKDFYETDEELEPTITDIVTNWYEIEEDGL